MESRPKRRELIGDLGGPSGSIATSRPLAPACSVGWERLRWGARGWAATAPKSKAKAKAKAKAPVRRTTVTTTTTTTTTFEEAEGEEAEPEAEEEVFWRDDPERNGARAHTWRDEADARWHRVALNLWKWRELLGFCGTALARSKDRYERGRIAIGVEVPSDQEYARVTAGTRWQKVDLYSGHA